MKVINRTRWNTDHLRAFARAVADRTLESGERKELAVEFTNSRTRGVAGHAYYGLIHWSSGPRKRLGWCRYVRISLPTGRLSPSRERFVKKWMAQPMEPDHQAARMNAIARWKSAPDKKALVAVLEHEMLHTIGQHHPGSHGASIMRGHYDDEELARERYAWAEALPLDHAATV